MWEVSGEAEDVVKKQPLLTDTGWTDGIEEKRKRGRREAIKGYYKREGACRWDRMVTNPLGGKSLTQKSSNSTRIVTKSTL